MTNCLRTHQSPSIQPIAAHGDENPVLLRAIRSDLVSHAWVALVTHLDRSGPVAGLMDFLPAAELERALAVPGIRARSEFVAARALLRCALAPLAACAPHLVPIEQRDRLVAPRPLVRLNSEQNLEASISHSAGNIMVGLSIHGAVGVDIELVGRCTPDAAKHALSSMELVPIRDLAPSWSQTALCHLWTVKEACIKATQMALPLRDVEGSLDRTGRWKRVIWSAWAPDADTRAAVALRPNSETFPHTGLVCSIRLSDLLGAARRQERAYERPL